MPENEFELVRDEVSEIITDTKDIVASFRNKVKPKRGELPNKILVPDTKNLRCRAQSYQVIIRINLNLKKIKKY